MDNLKSFFGSVQQQSKHIVKAQELRDVYGNASNRTRCDSTSSISSDTSVSSSNSDYKLGTEIKRKDSDTYFYIMWRS